MLDSVRLLKTKYAKTRKSHQCGACGILEPKGSIMECSTFVYDGRLIPVYRCYEVEECEKRCIKNNKYHD